MFENMRSLSLLLTTSTITLLMLNVSEVSGSAACLNCLNSDNKAGFLDSYSYCSAIDVCLEDAWNYIDYKCSSSWIRGNSMNIAACNPTSVTCPSYSSTEASYGVYTNTTQTLAANTDCTVSVDATLGVARVLFDDATNLGVVEVPDYTIGTPITVPQGQI